MKLFFTTLLALLLGSPLLYAQQDTTFTTVKEEMGAIEPQHYETQYDQAFGTRIPAKWMVKWDASNIIREEREFTTSIPNSIGFNIGVERKIVFGEVRGEIAENQIIYDIRVSNIMKGILLVDAILLIVFVLFQLLDSQFQLGLSVFCIGLIFALVVYFWITIEIHYLEKILKNEMRKWYTGEKE